MNKQSEAGIRNIMVAAEASSIEKCRKQVIAGQPETGQVFAMISDEGSYMPGGEGTAPSPLTYFVAGMALWMISHLSQVAAKRKLALKNEHVKVIAYFHERGSVLRGDAEGFCDHIEIEISIESKECQDKLCELFRVARKMCFTEKALTDNIPISVNQRLNGVAVES